MYFNRNDRLLCEKSLYIKARRAQMHRRARHAHHDHMSDRTSPDPPLTLAERLAEAAAVVAAPEPPLTEAATTLVRPVGLGEGWVST